MTNLLSRKTVADLVDLHPEHISRMARAGRFPKPIKFSDAKNSTVRFVAEEIEAWIAARLAEREAA